MQDWNFNLGNKTIERKSCLLKFASAALNMQSLPSVRRLSASYQHVRLSISQSRSAAGKFPSVTGGSNHDKLHSLP